jgi:hypothetical protein
VPTDRLARDSSLLCSRAEVALQCHVEPDRCAAIGSLRSKDPVGICPIEALLAPREKFISKLSGIRNNLATALVFAFVSTRRTGLCCRISESSSRSLSHGATPTAACSLGFGLFGRIQGSPQRSLRHLVGIPSLWFELFNPSWLGTTLGRSFARGSSMSAGPTRSCSNSVSHIC